MAFSFRSFFSGIRDRFRQQRQQSQQKFAAQRQRAFGTTTPTIQQRFENVGSTIKAAVTTPDISKNALVAALPLPVKAGQAAAKTAAGIAKTMPDDIAKAFSQKGAERASQIQRILDETGMSFNEAKQQGLIRVAPTETAESLARKASLAAKEKETIQLLRSNPDVWDLNKRYGINVEVTPAGKDILTPSGTIAPKINEKTIFLTKKALSKVGLGITAIGLVGGLVGLYGAGKYGEGEVGQAFSFLSNQAADNPTILKEINKGLEEIESMDFNRLEEATGIAGIGKYARSQSIIFKLQRMINEDKILKIEEGMTENDIITARQEMQAERERQLMLEADAIFDENQRILAERKTEETQLIHELAMARLKENERLQKQNQEEWFRYLKEKARLAEETQRRREAEAPSQLGFGLL